ncbi:hypothetical protein [Chloracidobacterium aggregatum]|jgi:hypothetical protein|uniref:Uncharacterized protein n=1 Tax=Chloracidobacterium sp. N TaxID=2821540 RepID=A0ABX8B369_9BACT|nr:hypothetical protein [Chloracidobacterium aggregatum]QUV86541.1 hypothetical protein J8C03_13005 [Chloracidobacterium sp. 2]QUV89028.1 hypothetical protein J8C07_14465 [Chloracidobacterium sp. S]QUV92164.1 hypothetical protein J8C04_14735 [Chloracidobacterium sp. A]QUV95439.1 hypothetical protein J8C05_11375 [Chloracidobacterium sp. N]QUV98661.1 hypothetical protein J8C00_12600 [Chloracidobacterium sp. E]
MGDEMVNVEALEWVMIEVLVQLHIMQKVFVSLAGHSPNAVRKSNEC